MFTRNPQPKTLPELMNKFKDVDQIHGFVKTQLLAGARFAMIMLQICHPKLDMSNTVELCHARLKKRKKNIDKINDEVTPVAEKMIFFVWILSISPRAIMLIPWMLLRKAKGYK
jgi:hypothetical protein